MAQEAQSMNYLGLMNTPHVYMSLEFSIASHPLTSTTNLESGPLVGTNLEKPLPYNYEKYR